MYKMKDLLLAKTKNTLVLQVRKLQQAYYADNQHEFLTYLRNCFNCIVILDEITTGNPNLNVVNNIYKEIKQGVISDD